MSQISSTVRTGLLVAVAVITALIAFHDALSELVTRWIREEEYSHGFLIPIVSAWLLWTRRDAVLASIDRPSLAAPVVILFAILMHLVGEYSSLFVFSQVAFILVLVGLTLAVGGYSLLKVTFVPIAFLIFAIPLPYFIESKLTLQLQLISSQLGVDVIRLFNIPVYLEGNIIDLGNYKLMVVEACSGLRYLYPLLSLSFLAAYLFQAPIWQRLVVFLSGIPITIAMNGFRIGLVGITVDRWGSQMADGVLHFFEGWIIFIACAAILIAEIAILARLSGRRFFQVFHVPAWNTNSFRQTADTGSTGQAALLSCFLLLCGAGAAVHLISHRPEIIPERARFADFPVNVGELHGHPSSLDADTIKALGFDDYILSDYIRPGGKPVNLYVAYYSSQRNGYTPHSPLVCIPGGGWLITNLQQATYKGFGYDLPFNRMIIQQDAAKELVYYWYNERGRPIANEYWAKWYLLSDAIIKNRTDGALIRLMTDILPDESQQDADRRLQSFMQEIVPTLGAYLPSKSGLQSKSARSSDDSVHG
jgi:exosortase D (VPLPA-CTERM-specific)